MLYTEDKLRGEIEKVLWKHYDSDSAMNAEEIMDDIMPLFQSYKDELVERGLKMKKTDLDYSQSMKYISGRNRVGLKRQIVGYNFAIEDFINLIKNPQ